MRVPAAACGGAWPRALGWVRLYSCFMHTTYRRTNSPPTAVALRLASGVVRFSLGYPHSSGVSFPKYPRSYTV